MVVLRQDVALCLHLRGHLSTQRPLAGFQRVFGTSFPVLHQTHCAEGAGAQEAQGLQVREPHSSILDADAVLQILLHLLRDDLLEHRLLQRPQLRRLAGDLNRGASGFVEEQGALPEGGVLALGADLLPVDGHCDLALDDHKEVVPLVPLPDDHLRVDQLLVLQGHDYSLRLLLVEVPEDGHLLHREHLLPEALLPRGDGWIAGGAAVRQRCLKA
mmetsp:Transcript_3781/g.9017  ORF Transcript_3781/g.9017 Transcript_3781/m.9017 type:complete len:215 (+) Transcript_3781:936-1580(+)